ncbi:GDSL-type esterase/lipase family protein [Thermovirga sp.]|uniref:GDSL-type esterase/lipase family protein n=1 Tax=Thermovirga sp. TaxID=2699834 RepID=UPI0025FE7473|nr:GDSL-type esterase/lipase family protein [Thermovirga sp.]MBO8153757.1 arylesterase [Thermovirga sp.]
MSPTAEKWIKVSFKVCVIAVVILWISAFAPVEAEAKVKIMPLKQGDLILAFGDSLTFGTGAPKGQSYPEFLQDELGLEVINAGVPGELASKGAKRLSDLLEEYNPSLVLICHGGNDILHGRPDELIEQDLAAMAETVKFTPADLVIIGVPKPGLGLVVPSFYETVAEKYNALYEGEVLREVLSNPSLKSDLIHPNAEGYRIIAEALAKLIKKSQW